MGSTVRPLSLVNLLPRGQCWSRKNMAQERAPGHASMAGVREGGRTLTADELKNMGRKLEKKVNTIKKSGPGLPKGKG